jgi:hypothetical protein
MTRQTFFEHAVAERDLGHDFLELPILRAQSLHFVAGRFANGVTSQLLLARFEKVLAPAVVEVRGDAFTTTQFRDTLLASKALEHNADLLLGGELATRAATDLANCGFSGLLAFLAHVETLLGGRSPVKCLLV